MLGIYIVYRIDSKNETLDFIINDIRQAWIQNGEQLLDKRNNWPLKHYLIVKKSKFEKEIDKLAKPKPTPETDEEKKEKPKSKRRSLMA